MGKVKARTLLIDILSAIITPITLQYQLTVSKFMRVRILKLTDFSLASSFEKVCTKIKIQEEQLHKHARLQLGLETIFQLAGNVVLLSYGYSRTKTSQGLAALFKKDKMTLLDAPFWTITLSSELILGILLAMNLITFVRVNFRCIVEGYGSNCKIIGKMLLLTCIAIGSLIRISSMTLYFAPTLGLFNLTRHYQGTFLKSKKSIYCWGC